MKNKLQTCDLANEKVKDIIKKPRNPKFSNLHLWMNKQAKFYHNENKHFGQKKRFRKYRRGTIIYVDFGTSIGAELCGYHFAVVLTKNDNPYNEALTVMPLTSKNKPYNVSIGREIILDIITEFSKNLSDMNRLLNFYISPEDSDLSNEQINELTECANVYKSIAVDEGNPINSTTDLLLVVIEWLKEIRNTYKGNDKESFLMPNSITTISKFRIRLPLNPLDPIGKISVTENALSVIDHELIKRLVSDNLVICDAK